MHECIHRKVRPLLRPAFTLLEVLIVLSLLVLLTAMAWPLMQSQITASELPESAARIRDALYMTRSSAMFEHRRHRIRFAREVQQPVVEIEVDPILRPGEWIPVAYSWTREPFLLADVQVYAIHPGRPAWLKPYSETQDAVGSDSQKAAREELNLNIGVTAGQQIGSIAVATGKDDADFDEYRPPIVFETDGSTDWATIVLARVSSGAEIEETEPQKWVILDGRTGLAAVQDALTDEQMSDPEFFVRREKLEFPDAVAPEDITLTMTTDEQGNVIAPDDASAATDANPFDPTAASGALPDLGSSDPALGQPVGGTAALSPEPGVNEPEAEVDPQTKLEQELEDSDLSEEEKEKIRKNLQGGS